MSDLIENLPQIRPWTPADQAQLVQAAGEDNHVVVKPTHIVEKRGEIVGYASILPVALVNTWLHSQKMNSRESFHMLNLGENLARNLTGLKTVLLPCATCSPFYPFIEKFGYSRLGTTTLNMKGGN